MGRIGGEPAYRLAAGAGRIEELAIGDGDGIGIGVGDGVVEGGAGEPARLHALWPGGDQKGGPAQVLHDGDGLDVGQLGADAVQEITFGVGLVEDGLELAEPAWATWGSGTIKLGAGHTCTCFPSIAPYTDK